MSRKHKKHKKHGFHRNPGNPEERLFRRITSSGLWEEARVETRPPGTERMSDVILRFAAPLLDKAGEDKSYDFALEFCIVVWNLSLLPPEDQFEQRQHLVEQIVKGDAHETQAMIDMLLDRKAALFPEYRRAIVDYTLSFAEGQRHLTVASTEMRR